MKPSEQDNRTVTKGNWSWQIILCHRKSEETGISNLYHASKFNNLSLVRVWEWMESQMLTTDPVTAI